MFIFKEWEIFCSQIFDLNIRSITALEALTLSKTSEKYLIVKHDVETNVEKALKLAQIENKYAVRATYYVQSYLLKNLNNVETLKKIKDLGHEVTYHYDVLDANSGNYDLAEKEFDETLLLFENFGFEVKTVCPHGNPVMERDGWSSNKDFFRNKKLNVKYSAIADIVINPEKFINHEMIYISDAGFGWKIISDISNNDNKGELEDTKLKGLSNIVALLSNQNKSFIISAHPHRWNRSKTLANVKKNLFFTLRFAVRTLTKIPIMNRVIGKFYYLAKKI